MPDIQNEIPGMQSLQQDAIRRAREMQARAHFPSGHSPSHPPENRQAAPHNPIPVQAPSPPPAEPVRNEPHPHTEQMPVHPRPAAHNPPPEDPPAGGALDFLLEDGERSLIMILLLILMEEKADNTLVFALLYLIL